jgi:hypothetical protein
MLNQNQLHFSQATPSPGASGRLSTLIPPFSRNLHTDSILASTFDTTDIDPLDEVCLFLDTMAHPLSLQGIETIDITITAADFQTSSFTKLPENTSSSPSGRHLTHYKLLACDANLSALLATMITIPFRHGFAPSRWLTAIQIMLEKDPGNPQIHCLRVIQLLEADMNLAFRLLWGRRLVHHALSHDALTTWNFGNLPGVSCLSAVLLKVISYDYIRARRLTAVVFINDDKA